jgi:adenylate kinase family enzyme
LAAYDATSTPLIEYYKQRGTLLNFELTSGVADMWPKLEKAVTEWLKR